MIVAGLGCRSASSAAQIESALAEALRRAPRPNCRISFIAIPAAKRSEAGIHLAAAALGIPVLLIEQPALEAASSRTVTRSHRSRAAMNVDSVAEAAALAAAGAAGRLLAPRIAVGPVTCALAEGPLPT